MRNRFVSLLILLVLCGSLHAQAVTESAAFDAGNAAFELGDYVQAEREYQTAIDSGILAPHLFYNLAVAQEELGQPVRAAINYRRALFLEPTLVQAWRNLEGLSDSAGLPMPPFSWREEVSQIVNPSVLLVAGSILAWAGAIFLLLILFGQRRRVWLGFGSFILILAGCGLAVVGWLSDPLISYRGEGMIVAENGAQMRGTPSDNAAGIRSLRAGEAVEIIAERGPWTFVKTGDDVEGWVDAETVEAIIPRPPENSEA